MPSFKDHVGRWESRITGGTAFSGLWVTGYDDAKKARQPPAAKIANVTASSLKDPVSLVVRRAHSEPSCLRNLPAADGTFEPALVSFIHAGRIGPICELRLRLIVSLWFSNRPAAHFPRPSNTTSSIAAGYLTIG